MYHAIIIDHVYQPFIFVKMKSKLVYWLLKVCFFLQKSNKCLPSFTYEINDLEEIIKNIDSKKSQGSVMLSITS